MPEASTESETKSLRSHEDLKKQKPKKKQLHTIVTIPEKKARCSNTITQLVSIIPFEHINTYRKSCLCGCWLDSCRPEDEMELEMRFTD